MTDRELLELAARAVGNGAQWDNDERGMMVLSEDGVDTNTWNPLVNDGDSFALMVKLGLEVRPYFYHDSRRQIPAVATKSGCGMIKDVNGVFPQYTESNLRYPPRSATRRAIVIAAAEIGKVSSN